MNANGGAAVSGASRAGRVLAAAVRIVAVVLIGLLVGGGAYAIAVWTVNQVVTPVQEHSFRLDQLDERTREIRERSRQVEDDLADSASALEGRMAGLGERIEELALELEANQHTIAAQQSQLDELRTLQAQLADLERRVADVESETERLREQQALDRLAWETLQVRVTSMRAMVLVTRADSLIARGELDEAERTIRAVIEEVLGLPEPADGTEPALQPVVERLELALDVLHARPEVAAEDLDAAWALLAGISQE